MDIDLKYRLGKKMSLLEITLAGFGFYNLLDLLKFIRL